MADGTEMARGRLAGVSLHGPCLMSSIGIDIGIGVGRPVDLGNVVLSVRPLIATTEDMHALIGAYLVERALAGGEA